MRSYHQEYENSVCFPVLNQNNLYLLYLLCFIFSLKKVLRMLNGW